MSRMNADAGQSRPEYKPDAETLREWHADFDAALNRPLNVRIDNAFIRTYKPVMDDGPGVRTFETMNEYREWCNRELAEWLGYHR